MLGQISQLLALMLLCLGSSSGSCLSSSYGFDSPSPQLPFSLWFGVSEWRVVDTCSCHPFRWTGHFTHHPPPLMHWRRLQRDHVEEWTRKLDIHHFEKVLKQFRFYSVHCWGKTVFRQIILLKYGDPKRKKRGKQSIWRCCPEESLSPKLFSWFLMLVYF